MPLVPRIASLWRTLFRRRRLESELDEELRGYVDSVIERKVREGMDPVSARRAALLETGGVEQVKEATRDARIGVAVETTLLDIRQAWRGVWKTPAFAIATTLTLGLGIGANTAIFSIVHSMLLAPLPYRDPSRLVFVWSDMTEAGYPRAPLSGPELADLRQRSRLFSGFGAIWASTAALTGDGEPEQLRIGRVTADFFSVLGAEAERGRTFRPGDDAPGAPARILLSASVWQRRYGGDAAIVGRRIVVNGRPATVVGVMPATFRLLLPPDAAVADDLQAWTPFWGGMTEGPRGQQFLRVVGRLRPGVPLETGRREIESIAAQTSREFPEYGSAGRRYVTVDLHADGVREIRPLLLALFGGVVLLVLITCVNVAGLLGARTAARRQEIALRVALGAGRSRLFRQCVIEGLTVALLGAAAGLLLARSVLSVLAAAAPESLARIASARIDGGALAFTAGTTLFWGLLLSLVPLLEVFRTAPLAGIARASGPSRSRTRAVLVGVQIALGAVLVVGAGLVARTFLRLQSVDPGFRSDGVLSFRLTLPDGRYRRPEAFNAFGRRFEAALSALPGVVSAAAVSHIPYDHIPNWGGPYLASAGMDESSAPMADYRAVSPRFFETVGARLVAGRNFLESDDERSNPVVIVDEKLARRAWPGQNAVGRRLSVDPQSTGHPTVAATVVGVVRHLRSRSVTEEVREQAYFAQRQIRRNPAAYVVRSSGDPAALAAPIRQALAAIDPELPIFDVRPLSEYLVAARGSQRFTMTLAAAFAATALLLACIGLYGVVVYSVASRRRELGVRLALGALPRQVHALVVRDGLRVAAVGLVLGLPGAAVAARLLRSQLFGISPGDFPSYAIALSTLALAALAASWLAARKATSASPLEVLRAE